MRRGIERLARRNGAGSDSGSEDEDRVAGKGKAKAVEVVQEAGAEAGGDAVPAAPRRKRNKGKAKVSRRMISAEWQADWNPNLLKTQATDTSDFDSSDSGNDSDEGFNEKAATAEVSLAYGSLGLTIARETRSGTARACARPVQAGQRSGGATRPCSRGERSEALGGWVGCRTACCREAQETRATRGNPRRER